MRIIPRKVTGRCSYCKDKVYSTEKSETSEDGKLYHKDCFYKSMVT